MKFSAYAATFRTRFRVLTGIAASLLLLNAVAAKAESQQDLPGLLEFTEWQVPWENTRPRDPYVSPDGSVWFVGQLGDYLAQLDPETGEMQRFEIPKAGPHTEIVDADGIPWYAGNKDQHIGQVNSETGEITRFDMPKDINDPHTMDWTSDGDIWFTVQRSGNAGFIGKLTVTTGEVDIITVSGNGKRPYGLVVDQADRPWIAFMGDNAIGTVDPDTMELEIFKTPDEDSIIRRIGLTSDGRIWWVDAAVGFMGVFNPEDKSMKQWLSPAGEVSGLYAMTIDHQDLVWYVETALQPNRFIGFDTNTEQFISMDEVPSGGLTIRHMVFDEKTNAIWFGTDAHTIGRAIVPD